MPVGAIYFILFSPLERRVMNSIRREQKQQGQKGASYWSRSERVEVAGEQRESGGGGKQQKQ
jgi:hypothetical protein